MPITDMPSLVPYLSAIVDSSDDAIIGKDLNGIITTWNRAAEGMFGYSASEALGRPVSILAAPSVANEMPAILARIRSGETVAHYETVRRHKDGTEIHVSLTVSPIRDSAGRVVGASKILRNITESKKAEQNLQQAHAELKLRAAELETEIAERKRAEDRFRLVVEAAPNAMIMIGTDGRIVLINSQTEKLFGYDRVELHEQLVEILVPERFRNVHRGHRGMFFSAPTARPMGAGRDLFGVRKDGTEMPIEIGLNPIESSDGTFVLSSIIDITERKRAQDEIAAAKLEIESRNKDLETMLHVTSHDLREPVRALQNFSKMLADRYASQIDEKGQDLLARMKRGADRLDRLLLDILNVARAGRISPPTGCIPGRLIVADALRALSSRIAETHAHIHVAEDLPSLCVSLAWGSVAIQNLIANALKFTRENTPPEIEIRPFAGDHEKEDGIIVRDRGLGVAPQHAERIFQLFQRAVGREIEGTGAGLAIVRQIAERHGGRAWVQTRDNGGSDFIITFENIPRREALKASARLGG
jgi:PAS domain S-box-containing protein